MQMNKGCKLAQMQKDTGKSNVISGVVFGKLNLRTCG